MRILHLSPFYPPLVTGGAELYVHDLAREQAASGHDVHVATLVRAAGPAERRDGVLVHPLAYWNSVWPGDPPERYARLRRLLAGLMRPLSPTAFRRFDKVVACVRPDIVHAHTMNGLSTSMWLSPRLRGIPLVHTLHDFSHVCARSNAFRDGRICARPCRNCRVTTEANRLFERCLDGVVGVGTDILARHRALDRFAHLAPERCAVIGNPVRLVAEAMAHPPAERRRTGPFTFGMMGRLVPEKGVLRLLEAVSRLPAGLDWRLRLAGTAAPGLDLDAWVRRLPPGRLTVEGWTRPEAFLAGIDVFVAPVRWAEPFGRTVIEAYAHGVPVLASRVGGLQDLVDEGRTGWLVSPDDDRDLLDRLGRLISGGRDRLPQADVLAAAAAPYHPAAIARRHDALYRVLVAGAAS